MSSRNQKIVESPVTKWFTWKTISNSDDVVTGGTLVSYNKETKQNEPVELPFSFALINDSGVTFSGYNEKMKQGVWSNEGSDKNHEIVLKTKDEVLLKFKLGDYKENKDAVEGFGAKYTKVVIGAVPTQDGGFELVGIKFSGAALTGGVDKDNFDSSEKMHGYFNFTKAAGKSKIFSNYITLKDYAIKKKGKTKFGVPVFEVGQEVTEVEDKALRQLTDEYDNYLKYYHSKKEETVAANTTDEDDFTN